MFMISVATATLIAAMAILVLMPVARTGNWMSTHENIRYVVLAEQFRTALEHGYFYPRWLPDLYAGYGYPVFCFYQPGFFFFVTLLSFLPTKTAYHFYIALWILLVVGAGGAYRLVEELVRRSGGSPITQRVTGLFGGALFLLTPYLWVDLYVRGDLSELMALCLTPWPLYGMLRIAARETPAEAPLGSMGSIFFTGMSLAAVVYAHPIVAMFLFPASFLLALSAGEKSGRRRFHVHVALAFALGVLLSAPYWLPLAQLRSEVAFERAAAGYYQASEHVVLPSQLFSRTWNFGGSIPGPGDSMSFQLGLVHFAIATAGAWLGRKDPVMRASYAVYVIYIVMMTAVATWLWRHAPLLKAVQFPWRLLSVTAVLQVTCAAGLARLVNGHGMKRYYAPALAGLLVLGTVWHRDQMRINGVIDLEREPTLRDGEKGVRALPIVFIAGTNEFLPKTVRDPSKLTVRSKMVRLDRPAQSFAYDDDNDFTIHRNFKLKTAAHLTINQFFFPGWYVEIDGKRVDDAELRRRLPPDGRIRVRLPAGAHEIRAYYDGPPGWRWTSGFVVVGLVMVVAFWKRESRLIANRPPTQPGHVPAAAAEV